MARARNQILLRLWGIQAAAISFQTAQAHCLAARQPLTPTGVNQHWSLDFFHDQTSDGRASCTLAAIERSRPCPSDVRKIGGSPLAPLLDHRPTHGCGPIRIVLAEVIFPRI